MERAQQKVESRNFEIRKTLLKFDSVMNDQRQVIFGQRLEIMKSKDISSMINSFFNEVVKNSIDILGKFKNDNDIKSFSSGMRSYYGNVFNDKEIESFSMKSVNSFEKELIDSFKKKKEERVKILGKKENDEIEKKIFLQLLDFLWRSHLQYLEHLRQVIGFRSYGQKDPLLEFRKEAFKLFEDLLSRTKVETIKFLFNLNIVIENKEVENSKNVGKKRKISRNDPCTCGSGKKYKHCCGRAA